MKSVEVWDEVVGIGKLETEINLIVGYEPVLFVCREINNHNNRYLFMTYDSFDGIYVFRKINESALLDMLNNKKTMEETFRSADCIYETYVSEEDNLLKYKIFSSSEFDSSRLPDKNEYFELRSDYILQYIDMLQREQKIQYMEYDIDCCTKKEYQKYCKESGYILGKLMPELDNTCYNPQTCSRTMSYADCMIHNNQFNNIAA